MRKPLTDEQKVVLAITQYGEKLFEGSHTKVYPIEVHAVRNGNRHEFEIKSIFTGKILKIPEFSKLSARKVPALKSFILSFKRFKVKTKVFYVNREILVDVKSVNKKTFDS